MLSAEAGFLFAGVILYISDVQGQRSRICVLNASSVDLPCSAQVHTSNLKWYTVHKSNSTYFQKEIPVDMNRVTYNKGSNFTLTIKDLTDSDENVYCCSENTERPDDCWNNGCELQVIDVQVKVIPAEDPDEQTVTLMCDTSCALAERPAAYIWYKNGQFLYEDWSPWYQQQLGSDQAATYSCAIKEQEALRAPQVSVDSVSSACFTVNYAKGRMCSSNQKSVDKPCSITYPRVLHVENTVEEDFVTLSCNSSCPVAEPHTAFRWYINRELYSHCENQHITMFKSYVGVFTCAVKGRHDLLSDELNVKSGLKIRYSNRRICALEGSSVTISNHALSYYVMWNFKSWYETKASGKHDAKNASNEADHVNTDNVYSMLTLNNLMKNLSGEYSVAYSNIYEEGGTELFHPGLILVVTDLRVTMVPSSAVTAGHRVTMSCTTSCPLTRNTTYMWFFNGLPLSLPESPNKHLILDPVSVQHAGNYSCAVRAPHNISSSEEALTVQSLHKTVMILNGIKGAVLLLLSLSICLVCMRMRRKKTLSSTAEPQDQVQMELHYEGIPMTVRNPVAAANKEAERQENERLDSFGRVGLMYC